MVTINQKTSALTLIHVDVSETVVVLTQGKTNKDNIEDPHVRGETSGAFDWLPQAEDISVTDVSV
jgi:hypothetical protein